MADGNLSLEERSWFETDNAAGLSQDRDAHRNCSDLCQDLLKDTGLDWSKLCTVPPEVLYPLLNELHTPERRLLACKRPCAWRKPTATCTTLESRVLLDAMQHWGHAGRAAPAQSRTRDWTQL